MTIRAPRPKPSRRPLVLSVVLLTSVVAALAIGGGGSSLGQVPSFCPPVFDPPANIPVFPTGTFDTGTATRSGKVEDVRLSVKYGPTCKLSMTATAVRGNADRVVLPFTTTLPATAKAFRLHASNLCDVTVSRALHVVGRANRGTCEQALLAFYVGPTPSPKEGKAVRATTCQVVGIARRNNQATTRAHRTTIPVTIEVVRIGGQQGLLFDDQIIIKISDPSVGTPYIAAPNDPAQLKECNAP
jgi:hypothetical protein